MPDKEQSPSVTELKAKVERGAKRGPVGPDLGAMSYAERDEALFGDVALARRLRYWESNGHPHGRLHREAAARLEALHAEREAIMRHLTSPTPDLGKDEELVATLRGATRGLCSKDATNYIPRGVSEFLGLISRRRPR
jgi:hypothetical protein